MFSAASLTRSMRRCCCCAKTAPRYSALTSASACTQPAPVRRCWSACDDKSTAKSDARRFSCKRELITKRCWLAVWVRQEKVTVDTRRRFFLLFLNSLVIIIISQLCLCWWDAANLLAAPAIDFVPLRKNFVLTVFADYVEPMSSFLKSRVIHINNNKKKNTHVFVNHFLCHLFVANSRWSRLRNGSQRKNRLYVSLKKIYR